MKDPLGRGVNRLGLLISMAVLLSHASVGFAASLLGSAVSFAVLGASTITNTNPTTISGNVGIYAGTSITGFPPGIVSNGVIHGPDAVSQTAQADETYAYNTLKGLSGGTNEGSTDLGTLGVLTPGIYMWPTSAQLTGTLTLNFQGNANALFVFQIGSTLTTASSATVLVINGTASDGIYWQVGSSATLGTSTTFAGNILALASITLNTSAKIECGRAFAQTGAVTMDTNVISDNCGIQDFGSGRSDFGSSGYSSAGGVTVSTPEPGTFLLLGISLIGIAAKSCARKS